MSPGGSPRSDRGRARRSRARPCPARRSCRTPRRKTAPCTQRRTTAGTARACHSRCLSSSRPPTPDGTRPACSAQAAMRDPA
eukprot:5027907-Prymnesium_polylepis.2